MLQQAKEKCDYLVVGLLVDPTIDRPETKNAPVQSMMERYVQVAGCKYVDEIIPFSDERDLENMILMIQPDVRIVGEEYLGSVTTGADLCPIEFNSRKHPFSSSELRDRVCRAKDNID
jgi:glycerol-3-phosphate cytidylyltransferase